MRARVLGAVVCVLTLACLFSVSMLRGDDAPGPTTAAASRATERPSGLRAPSPEPDAGASPRSTVAPVGGSSSRPRAAPDPTADQGSVQNADQDSSTLGPRTYRGDRPGGEPDTELATNGADYRLPGRAQPDRDHVGRGPLVSPLPGSDVTSRSETTSQGRRQLALVATLPHSPQSVLRDYRVRLVAHGFREVEVPAVGGGEATGFRRGKATVSLTASGSGPPTEYSILATLGSAQAP